MKYNILSITSPKIGGCEYYRLVHPHEDFPGHEFSITHRHVFELISNKTLSIYQLVLFHKNFVTADFLRKLRGLDIKTMVDFDDYWTLPTGHPSYRNYQQENKSKKFIEIIKLADYISVPTERLAIEVQRYNKNVYIFPNAISLKHANIQPVQIEWDRMQFGYMGGSSHLQDVKLLRGLNNRLMTSGLEYNFNLFGYKHGSVYEDYENILTSNKKYKTNLTRIAPLPVPEYLVNYTMLDVSLVPLKKNRFNALKSELKLIEAGSFNVPVIASNVHPYKNIIKYRKNSLVASSKSDWYNQIRYCIKNPQAVKDLGNQLNLDIQKHFDYDRISRQRQEVYRSIIDKG